ncbi:RagB/SusD family nutrient uptake outer membrane protein [Chitinophaga sp. SYP-B3965]|uniref:RagB/SusD family nutrient uptake outer membrane protein n=1 Tax=Chitinophaga sp. SYP-B3965 TaxID=2663120 RepID=UPI00129975FE|nr:RagB/SusD family nutrient uptake outer membrane protein [Chitinophaga sp. SYP-B3965]MRG45932.1 RagB/SusD family nutrient uptake outer membrane protein [Chitinophaga sp. SYP-B3965]
MKTIQYISYLFLFILLSACGKVIDKVEDLGNYPAAGTFDDPLTSAAFLSNVYASTFTSGWPYSLAGTADEGGGILGDGWITTDNDVMKFWPYVAVRKANILLKELPAGKLAAEIKDPMIGQAKFLRAYLYFKMVYYYGGVPIIQVPQELTDDLKVTRNTTAECFDFILKDLDEAAALVPPKYTGNDRGKIDQACVLALKGKVLLYKASPQFNPANPYDNANWATAYTANKAAKDFLDVNGYGLLDDFSKLFETKGHKENILSVIYVNPAKTNGRGEDGVRPLSESKNATGYDQPTWGMAEAFTMKDGRKPGDPASAYAYNVQTFWQNRDPRFDATMVWNGSIYELSGIKGRRQYTMSAIAKSMDAFGLSVQGENHYRTGLYTRKGIMEELPSTQVTLNDVDWPEMRYAEVLFNYAEAANETGKPAEALQVLKDIRKRAGIEIGGDGMYGLKTGMTRVEMRQAILDEKRVEFMFEGQRFWDLRRHRMLNVLNGARKYGIMATKVNGLTYDQVTATEVGKANRFELQPQDFTYEVVELITNGPKQMVMPDKYYFFPIQLSNINQNPNLKQNKDWGGDFDPTLH